MRLLNIKTLKLESYDAENTAPPYVILSHTWGEDEVLFEDLQDMPQVQEIQSLRHTVKDLEQRLSDFQHRIEGKNEESGKRLRGTAPKSNLPGVRQKPDKRVRQKDGPDQSHHNIFENERRKCGADNVPGGKVEESSVDESADGWDNRYKREQTVKDPITDANDPIPYNVLGDAFTASESNQQETDLISRETISSWTAERDEEGILVLPKVDKEDNGKSSYWLNLLSSRTRQKRGGWNKIFGCCKEADTFGFSHVWIDTCCIDKSSSSELSESINSMFSWYKNAGLCVAYLSDVSSGNTKEFGDSKWFLRGWTLQELIAPDDVWFYDKNWEFLGARSALTPKISSVTLISRVVLDKNSQSKMSLFSVAARLSWAAARKTTRAEDRAYSLMGIFGINMPTIYGEGEQAAFFRLQVEIFKALPDHSIFAWNYPFDELGGARYGGGIQMFAPKADVFIGAGSIECAPYSRHSGRYKDTYIPGDLLDTKSAPSYSRFSHGICVTLLLCPIGRRGTAKDHFRACLACKIHGSDKAISVDLLEDEDGSFLRVLSDINEVDPSAFIESDWLLKDVYLSHLCVNISRTYHSHSEWRTYNVMRISDGQILNSGFERIPSTWEIPNTSTTGDLNPKFPRGSFSGGDYVVDLFRSISDSGNTKIEAKGYGALMYRHSLTKDLFAIVFNFGSYYGAQVAVMDHFKLIHNDGLAYVFQPPDEGAGNFWEDLTRHAVCKQLKCGWHIFASKSPSVRGTLQVNIRAKRSSPFELGNDDRIEENNYGFASVRISVSQWDE